MENVIYLLLTLLIISNFALLYFLIKNNKISKNKDFIINQTRLISRKMYELGSKEEFIRDICSTVKKITNSDEFVYFSFDEKEKVLIPEYTDGPYKDQLKNVKVKLGEGFSGFVAKERKGMFLNGANKSTIAKHVPGTPDEDSSLLAIPIIYSGELLGIILQTKLGGSTFDKEELKKSEIFVNLTAGYIAGEKYVRKLKEGFIETLKLLVSTVELKDTYTAGHSMRVAKISELIARKMLLPEKEVIVSKIGGLLHDVGKIGTKEELLRKKGLLDEKESFEIRKHVDVGANLIAQFRMFDNVVESIKHHHEWYNGAGYPDGLKGDAIPQTSRIIIVADAIDAMTSKRPGKETKNVDEALEELQRFSGIQFDPKVVEVTLSIKKEIAKIISNGVSEEEFADESDFTKISQ